VDAMEARTESRLEPARRRAASAKRALALASGVGLLAALLLGRASHPARASSPSPVTTPGPSSQSETFSFDQGDFAPSDGAAPQVQSGVS
jgi:hypothetical protein